MELTLKRYGIAFESIRERADESTTCVLRRLYRHHISERHPDHRKELLQASGSRYASPIR
jgi:hypothetical protein